MPLNVKNEEAHALARRLSEMTGRSITEVVTRALEEAYENLEKHRMRETVEVSTELDRIALECAALPIIDDRSSDEILGYDELGLPG